MTSNGQICRNGSGTVEEDCTRTARNLRVDGVICAVLTEQRNQKLAGLADPDRLARVSVIVTSASRREATKCGFKVAGMDYVNFIMKGLQNVKKSRPQYCTDPKKGLPLTSKWHQIVGMVSAKRIRRGIRS